MDIVERLRDQRHITQSDGLAALLETCNLAAAEIEKLHAERDEAKNQLDSALHSIDVLEKRLRAQTTWHRIDDPDNPPPKDGPHVRGLWVNVHEGCPYFQQDSGFIDYDTGRFLGYDGDDFGWDADDYTHWMPLPTSPEVK